ncbi:MAG: GntR family transcriptional regulator [Kangiellaceae bacterium]|nr:GntR family transcriptional regulator [Kangiellaceae bacterium]
MPLDFILSQTDGRPMYLQIMEQIKSKVSVGDWPQGQKLPSIRELAVATKVSVITVKRAYQELEREGIIVTQHGKGSFIAEASNLNSKLKEQEMDKHLLEAINIARSLGLSVNDLQQRLELLEQPKNKKSSGEE